MELNPLLFAVLGLVSVVAIYFVWVRKFSQKNDAPSPAPKSN
jgi:hypothetical protein